MFANNAKMLTAIISDLHGFNPKELIAELAKEGVKKVISLGDTDDPEILKYLKELKIPKILIAGNHDYNFVRGTKVFSEMAGFDPDRVLKLWMSFENERRFALTLPNSAQSTIRERKICYLHGALSSDCSEPELWGRIKDGYDEAINFRKMQALNYWVMIRGHDHEPRIISMGLSECPFRVQAREEGFDTRLRTGRRYIVTVGALVDGYYALLDSKRLKIKIQNIIKR